MQLQRGFLENPLQVCIITLFVISVGRIIALSCLKLPLTFEKVTYFVHYFCTSILPNHKSCGQGAQHTVEVKTNDMSAYFWLATLHVYII